MSLLSRVAAWLDREPQHTPPVVIAPAETPVEASRDPEPAPVAHGLVYESLPVAPTSPPRAFGIGRRTGRPPQPKRGKAAKAALAAQAAQSEPDPDPDPVEDDADPEPTEIPAYILDAAQAAGEWWAKSDRDPRIKFTPPVIVKLLTTLRDGLHYEPACALAGVTYSQFRNWMNRGEEEGESSPFWLVARAVKLAEAEAEGESVRYVRAASRDPRFWAAGMTFLERRHPDRWKRRDDSQVQVTVGVMVGIQQDDEQRRALLPDVVIRQIASNNADRSARGTEPISAPTFASDPSLSPDSHNT